MAPETREPKTEMRSCDIGQHIPCFDSCQLTTTWMCNIRSHTVAKKCDISHWFPCGADCRQTGGRTDVPKFLGWIDSQVFLA